MIFIWWMIRDTLLLVIGFLFVAIGQPGWAALMFIMFLLGMLMMPWNDRRAARKDPITDMTKNIEKLEELKKRIQK